MKTSVARVKEQMAKPPCPFKSLQGFQVNWKCSGVRLLADVGLSDLCRCYLATRPTTIHPKCDDLRSKFIVGLRLRIDGNEIVRYTRELAKNLPIVKSTQTEEASNAKNGERKSSSLISVSRQKHQYVDKMVNGLANVPICASQCVYADMQDTQWALRINNATEEEPSSILEESPI
ncbi:hypothetical protein HZH66_003033 [Vespula vulgaris]|uniref:Uncharacterized protein n=1 Tax=Vespula vulgaris TaxID=7454 RepID=A0A834KQT9_VESVU|nr:hypothetical protein HZH66_003033 [Vespula vulgaris]